jgi:hypothetical protein
MASESQPVAKVETDDSTAEEAREPTPLEKADNEARQARLAQLAAKADAFASRMERIDPATGFFYVGDEKKEARGKDIKPEEIYK